VLGPQWLPPPPVASLSEPSQIRLLETCFSKFLKVRRFELHTDQGPESITIVHGPGHDCAAVAAILLGPEGKPLMVLKTGDARMARVHRQDSYLKLGCVAGRLDKPGASAAKIALAELTEEIGGEVVGNSLRPLGEWLSPTMPFESTEADADFFSLVKVSGLPQGDGGGMEVAGLIGPVYFSFEDGFEAMQQGRVSDGGRACALYQRCADAMGYVSPLDAWIYDHPLLLERYQSLGLGLPQDPRPGALSPHVPEDFQPQGQAAELDGGSWTEVREVLLPEGLMLDGKCVHTAAGRPQGTPFVNQLVRLPYDRAKIANYALSPAGEPWVRFAPSPRPVMAIKALALKSELTTGFQDNPNLVRRDLEDVKIRRDLPLGRQLSGSLEILGEPTGASSGQCDLYYYFVARVHPWSQVDSSWVSLSQALELCRKGEGDAQSEATLVRLSRHLEWIPTLNLNLEAATRLL